MLTVTIEFGVHCCTGADWATLQHSYYLVNQQPHHMLTSLMDCQIERMLTDFVTKITNYYQADMLVLTAPADTKS